MNIKEDYLDSIYRQTGYSKNPLYDYIEPDDDFMDYIGTSQHATKFNIKKSQIELIKKAIIESAAHHRAQRKSMMATRAGNITDDEKDENIKYSESLIETRLMHMKEVAQIAKIIAHAMGLNEDFAEVIGLIHDIGHTWNGHSGERILSSIAMLNNCGYIVHNAMGAYILERENIIGTALDTLKRYNKNVDENEIKRFMRYVIDGIVAHNGEGAVGKIFPEEDKTAQDMIIELRKCFTEKGFDKKIMPATMEGAIIRYADIIAYTRSDILDGFRLRDANNNKILSKFDDDYLSIIGTLLAKNNNYTKMLTLENKFLLELYGLSRKIQELEEQVNSDKSADLLAELQHARKEREILQKKYDEFCEYKIQYAKEYISRIRSKSSVKTEITTLIQDVFIRDLIEASKDKGYITMTPLIRRTFFALRDLNVRRIVPYTRRKFESEKLPTAANALVNIFTNTLLKSNKAYVFNAIPEEVREELGIIHESCDENQLAIGVYETKMLHFYDGLGKRRTHEIYLNSVEAIKDITRHDVSIALGREKYDGELKELYEAQKIMPIRTKIGELGKTSETMTSKDEESLLQELIAEKMKDLERIIASKMAIEYIGAMDDETIKAVLLEKNVIASKDIRDGYVRPAPGTEKTDNGLKGLQDIFAGYSQMILPDDIDKKIEEGEFTL